MKAATTDDQRKTIYEVERIELEKLDEKYAAQLKALSDLEAEYGRLAEAKKKAAEVKVETAPTSVPAATSAPARTVSRVVNRTATLLSPAIFIHSIRRTTPACGNAWRQRCRTGVTVTASATPSMCARVLPLATLRSTVPQHLDSFLNQKCKAYMESTSLELSLFHATGIWQYCD